MAKILGGSASRFGLRALIAAAVILACDIFGGAIVGASEAIEAQEISTSFSVADFPVSNLWGRIAFDSDQSGNREIWVMSANGSGRRNLTNNPGSDFRPKWSPDGSKIAFISDRDGYSNLWVMNADGSNQMQISRRLGINELYGIAHESATPSWSPDGSFVVFSRVDYEGGIELAKASPDGATISRFVWTRVQSIQGSTSWSPKSSGFIFSGSAPGSFDIWKRDFDGLNPVRLTQTRSFNEWDPRWSPNGNQIAYLASFNNERSQLWTMGDYGQSPIQLTFDNTNKSGLSWSPDGMYLAYASTGNDQFSSPYDIWVRSTNDGAISNLTQSSFASEEHPDWIQSSFSAASPSRVFDTRPGQGGIRSVVKAKVGGGYELRVKVTDLPGVVPASGVGAVSMNVTVTEPDGAGFVTVYPCGAKPNTSSLNFMVGQTIPNAVIAPVSTQGEVCFYSSQSTHILADVNGWFASGTSFTAVSPSRAFDTRPSQGGTRAVGKQKIGGGNQLRVKVTDLPGVVPASGVGAVSMNVTVTEPDGPGYVTVYPCGTQPNASSLNYVVGQTIPNAVIAPVSAQGEVCFFSTQPTHILADVNGWFASGASFTAVSPSRVFDTRPGQGGIRTVVKQKVGGGYQLRVKVTDLSGVVPVSGVGAVSLNVTVTEPDGPGYVTVYPCGSQPNASSLNYVAGQTIPNAVIAPVSAQGEVCFYSQAPTHLLADVNGWFN